MDKQGEATLQREQAVRMRRFGIAAASYFLWILLIVVLHSRGRVADHAIWMIPGMIVSNAVFWILFRSGLNLRSREPSLSMPMMLMALGWAIGFTAVVPEMRGVNVVIFLIVTLFGVFNLRVRQYLTCWVIAVAGYGAAVWLTLPPEADSARIEFELIFFMLLAGALLWCTLFGYYIGRLRDKLQQRNAELRDALAQVESLAIRDDLTGIYNRRYLMEMLGREQQRALRHNAQFSLLMLDLDGFKEINDSKGHPAGDEVLRKFVSRLRDQVRGVDVVGRSKRPEDGNAIGRFGGEEFVAILPDTDAAGARQVAERIRAAVGASPIDTNEGPVALTVSIGVAEYQAGESVRNLLERVDRALYAAKRGGRNRVAGAPLERDGTPVVYPVEEGSSTSTESGR